MTHIHCEMGNMQFKHVNKHGVRVQRCAVSVVKNWNISGSNGEKADSDPENEEYLWHFDIDEHCTWVNCKQVTCYRTTFYIWPCLWTLWFHLRLIIFIKIMLFDLISLTKCCWHIRPTWWNVPSWKNEYLLWAHIQNDSFLAVIRAWRETNKSLQVANMCVNFF